MKLFAVALAISISLIGCAAIAQTPQPKPRVFVLTDIENEPDDAMSLVRFLTYASQFDIEGIAATTSVHQQQRVAPGRIRHIVAAYGKVRDNLEVHEVGYPTAGSLLDRVTEGLPDYGMEGVGEGKDSPASESLITAADKDDPRPMWVTIWGGPSVLAQALWKVRETRTADELSRFIAKLRVYTISDQDDSGPWLREQFPRPLLRGESRFLGRRGIPSRDLERHQRRSVSWPIRRSRFHASFQRVAGQERAAKRAARARIPPLGISYGRRHPLLLQPSR